jgi:imidazolonepropionase-like amidohydrolase
VGQQYDLSEMKALVDEAHMLGLKVAVHAHGAAGIKDAIRAGVDTGRARQSCRRRGVRSGEAARNVLSRWTSTTTTTSWRKVRKTVSSPESLEKERAIGRKQRETFRAAFQAGVKMIFGTDGGVYPNGDNAKQFAKMVEWGMTPLQAIQSATSTAADALGRPSDVGAIAVGRYGDLIAVAGDPLSDVTVLQSVAFVMKGGDVVKQLPRSSGR